jgi:hypothetical protein
MQSIQLANLNVVGHFPEPSAQSIQELRKFGEAARYMVSPTANMEKLPLPDFVLPLGEARAEWCRRHKGAGPA